MSGEKLDQCSFVTIHYIICECGEKFPSEDALKTHLEKAHPRKREKKEYKCGICNEVYTTEDECIKHYEANHLPVDINLDQCEAECDGCDDPEVEPAECVVQDNGLEEGEMPPDEVALEEAIEAIKQETIEEGEIPLEAGEIPVMIEMPRVPAKKKGRKIIPKTEPEPEMIFVIDNGENQGQIVSMLKKSGRLPRGARTICCEICGKRYASNAALRYHQRTHTGERPYQCTLCHKSFTMPLFLQVHVRTHTGERPYACPHCPKAFSNKAALLRHDRVHTGIKPYECPMCAKTFTQSNSMKLHVTTVHLRQPAPYKSKNRLIREQSRTGKPVNARKKIHAQVDSVEVLKNGLESYVLGPLKQDLENLKSDIDMIARGEFDKSAVQGIWNCEDSSDKKSHKVESEVKSDNENAVASDENVYEVENSVQSDEVYELDSAVQSDGNVYEVVEEVMYVDDDSIIAETN